MGKIPGSHLDQGASARLSFGLRGRGIIRIPGDGSRFANGPHPNPSPCAQGEGLSRRAGGQVWREALPGFRFIRNPGDGSRLAAPGSVRSVRRAPTLARQGGWHASVSERGRAAAHFKRRRPNSGGRRISRRRGQSGAARWRARWRRAASVRSGGRPDPRSGR